MKKSDLKKIIKAIVTEIHEIQAERLLEGKKGLSGMKKAPAKKENTQMGSADKSVTSTSKPAEKTETKKLPVKDKNTKGNTETDHIASGKHTPTLKEELVKMIREALATHTSDTVSRSNDPSIEPPIEPKGAEKQPEITQTTPSLVNIFINGVKSATIDLKKDRRGAEAIVASTLYGKGNNLDYDMDDAIVPKMKEMSNLYVDGKLPVDAALHINTNDKKFILGANRAATPVAPQA